MQKINFAYHVMMNKGLWDSISGIHGKCPVNDPLLTSKFEH